jgi:hypothetical protein
MRTLHATALSEWSFAMNAQNARFVDLSHDVEHGMITYKRLPAPLICDFLSR